MEITAIIHGFELLFFDDPQVPQQVQSVKVLDISVLGQIAAESFGVEHGQTGLEDSFCTQ